MGLDNTEQDRADLQAVLDDLDSGKLKLQHGQEDYVAGLKARLSKLDDKLGGRNAAWPRRPAA